MQLGIALPIIGGYTALHIFRQINWLRSTVPNPAATLSSSCLAIMAVATTTVFNTLQPTPTYQSPPVRTLANTPPAETKPEMLASVVITSATSHRTTTSPAFEPSRIFTS
jgi:hypothetical protein